MTNAFPVPADRYWADAPTEEVVSSILFQRDGYYRWLERSGFIERVLSLWGYYYNQFPDRYFSLGSTDTRIVVAGEEGEYRLLSVNHLRAIIHLIITYITASRPAWDAIASNSDHRSLDEARLVNSILDDYMVRRRLETRFRRAAEHSIVLTGAYMRSDWCPYLGRPLPSGSVAEYDESGNVVGGDIEYEGDFDFDNPTVFDVFHDPRILDWHDDLRWVGCSKSVLKWDLAALYPDLREKILSASDSTAALRKRLWLSLNLPREDIASDRVERIDFWHLPSPALPFGRHVAFVGESSDAILVDEDYDEKSLPIQRLQPEEMLLTSLGHSVGFDLMGSQELMNAELSTLATSHNALALPKIWIPPGEVVNQADLESGINVIQTNVKPEALNFLQTPRELFETIRLLVQSMEYTSGMNSLARGQPEASFKSGTALAMIDQKAMQFAQPLDMAYRQFQEDVGTHIARTLQKHAKSPRIASVVGVRNQRKMRVFSSEDIQGVDRVQVVSGSPFLRTIPGRVQFAEMLIQAKLVHSKEELLTVIETGDLESLTRGAEGQLSLIHEENEALMRGEIVEATILDNGPLHIIEQHSLLDSIEVRRNPVLLHAVLGHLKHHISLMMHPMSQVIAAVLGYQNPAVALAGQNLPGEVSGVLAEGAPPSPEDVGEVEEGARQMEAMAPPGMNPQALEILQGARARSTLAG